ncbi:hypothetical protein DPEC_G00325750 [Dallia pectoralis]|uniref:Uncharacterized protein n=1 Tax=Dallia pectoralis TaxID=75939 RepID=A0ACC2F7L9_DALPE|nr:hypothetical protein DPEC_G00325750 [Dallia pectoralis]
MHTRKVVLKCGYYVVLVDLHIREPLDGTQQGSSWFGVEHTQEVTRLVRDAVDQRVRLYMDLLHKRVQPKHKRVLPPAKSVFIKGSSISLVANFLKRHSNLRCVAQQQYGELRVFPERCVVCLGRAEDAPALYGGLTPDPTVPVVTVPVKAAEQITKSEYFSRPAVKRNAELNSSTAVKRSVLHKIVKRANVQKVQDQIQARLSLRAQSSGSPLGEESPEQGLCLGKRTSGTSQLPQAMAPAAPPEWNHGVGNRLSQTQPHHLLQGHSVSPIQPVQPGVRRPKPSVVPVGDLFQPSLASPKKVCPGSLSVAGVPSTELFTQTHIAKSSKHNSLPPHLSLSPHLLPPVKPKSKVFPASVEATAVSSSGPQQNRSQTTGEVELLTPGKHAESHRLLCLHKEQTNPNSPDASLRDPSVNQSEKDGPASVHCCTDTTTSRSTRRVEEKREDKKRREVEKEGNVARPSRLRRLKK